MISLKSSVVFVDGLFKSDSMEHCSRCGKPLPHKFIIQDVTSDNRFIEVTTYKKCLVCGTKRIFEHKLEIGELLKDKLNRWYEYEY